MLKPSGGGVRPLQGDEAHAWKAMMSLMCPTCASILVVSGVEEEKRVFVP